MTNPPLLLVKWYNNTEEWYFDIQKKGVFGWNFVT